VYAKCLENKCREIVESKLESRQSGFHLGRSTMDQIFILKQIFEKSWNYDRDLKIAYDQVPRDKLWRDLQEIGIDGKRLLAIQFF